MASERSARGARQGSGGSQGGPADTRPLVRKSQGGGEKDMSEVKAGQRWQPRRFFHHSPTSTVGDSTKEEDMEGRSGTGRRLVGV